MKIKFFFLLLFFMTIPFSGCVHLQADQYPTGLEKHAQPYIHYPAIGGLLVGSLVGVPLSIGLLPITLPLGYLMEGTLGAFFYPLFPLLTVSYGMSALFASIPYFLSLPFASPPLYDFDPARRFRAIEVVGQNKNRKALPRLYEILQKDLPENQKLSAQVIGKIGNQKSIVILLKILKETKGEKNLQIRYYCYQSILKLSTSKTVPFWIQESKKKNLLNVKISIAILGKISTQKALTRLIKMLDTPYLFFAQKALKKATKQKFSTDPSIWKKWLNGEQ